MMLEALSAISRSTPRVKGLGIGLNLLAKALVEDRKITARVYGNLLVLNPTIEYHRHLLFVPQYHDRKERAFIKRILRPGDYVIDVGANIGAYALQFARLVGPGGRVTAIEPEPGNFAGLLGNIALNGFENIGAEQLAVGEHEGTLSLSLHPSNPGGHSLLPIEGSQTVQVRCVPLSKIVEPRAARLLKIDIEGFERPALARFFADGTPKPDYIMLEDWVDLRAGDAVRVCLANGYRQIERCGANVILERI